MMRLMTALISLIFTCFVVPAFAGTTTLSTTFAFVTPNNNTNCNFVNVSSKALDVTVSIVDNDGNVLTSLLRSAVPPQGGSALDASFGGVDQSVHCVFAFSGSSKDLRAALELVEGLTTNVLLVLPAS